MGIISFLYNVFTGVSGNLLYNSLSSTSLEDKITACYSEAEKKFYEKYGEKYGDSLNSFLIWEENIEYLKSVILYNFGETINVNNFNHSTYNGVTVEGTKDAIDDFVRMFMEIVKRDYELNKIVMEAQHHKEQHNINSVSLQMYNLVKQNNDLLKNILGPNYTEKSIEFKEIIEIYYEEDKIEQEFKVIKWLSENNGHMEGVVLKAYIAYKNKQWELAYKLYKYLIESDSTDYELTNVLAIVCEKLGQYNEAMRWYSSILKNDEKNLNALFNIGTLFANRFKDYATALQFLLKAYEVSPKDSEVLNNIGLIYKKNRNYEEAKKYFSLAIESSKNNPVAYLNMGDLEMDAYHDLDKAVSYFEKYLKFDNIEKGVVYNTLGLIYGSIIYKNKVKAKEYFLKAMKSPEGSKQAEMNLIISESEIDHFDMLKTFSEDRVIDLFEVQKNTKKLSKF